MIAKAKLNLESFAHWESAFQTEDAALAMIQKQDRHEYARGL